MTKPAISIQGLWKEYQIGGMRPAVETFYDVLAGALRRPFRKSTEDTGSDLAAEKFCALRDVSFDIQPGEVVGVIGRNGAGKSTLLKILSRITAPTRGRVEVRGRLASLLEVGTGFHPELSGRENVYLNGAILGMPRRDIARKFDEIIAFADIEQFVDTPVKRYSSGMYIRLAFSVAAHLHCDVLFVDEVLAVGDIAFQRKCLNQLECSSQSGRAVLFVSHNVDAIRRLCRRGIVLEAGKVVADDAIQTALNRYQQASDEVSLSSSESLEILLNDKHENGVLLSKLSFMSPGGVPLSRVHTFDDFCVVIDGHAEIPLADIAFEIQIASLSGVVISRFSTRPDHAIDVVLDKGRFRVVCHVQSLSLPAGTYRVGAAVSIPNERWLFNALERGVFEVAESDVFGSGAAPNSARMICVQRYRWSVFAL